MRKHHHTTWALLLALALVISSMSAGFSTLTTQAAKASLKITNAKNLKKIWSGQTKTIKVNRRNVTYKSSNKKIASVTAKGKITGKRAGKATITVALKSNKKVKATVKVQVRYGGLTYLSYPEKSFTWVYEEGEDDSFWAADEKASDDTYPFMVESAPYNIYLDACEWESSDEDVAIIDEIGTVYFEDYGTTTLTCRYGNKEATMELTIEPPEDEEDYDDDEDPDYEDDEDYDDDDPGYDDDDDPDYDDDYDYDYDGDDYDYDDDDPYGNDDRNGPGFDDDEE